MYYVKDLNSLTRLYRRAYHGIDRYEYNLFAELELPQEEESSGIFWFR